MRTHGTDEVMTGPTCNQVEMAAPSTSTYVPDVAGASVADRAKAQELLEGVNEFCRSHSAATLTSQWRAGLSGQSPTHFFNPDPRSGGLDPANPRAALIYDGELGGVMFTGKPLPSLGSIPRAHNHEASTVEMVHVYCTTSLKEAFTPNRVLGVKADLRTLRLRIRPAVMDRDEAQLRAVLAKVRGYTGNRFQVPGRVEAPPGGGRPDPVLRGMRTEIRTSLFILTEAQLRSVWTLMRSY